MGSEVVLVGRAELDQILKSLKKFRDEADRGVKQVGNLGKKTNETLENSTKKAETKIKQTGSTLRRLAGQLYSDFKALMSLNALQGAMKMSSMFQGAVAESVDLSDTIRRLGASFGIAQKDFGNFQSALTKGLGDIGASSEEAARALEGLSGLGIKDKNALINMTKGAVTLGGISGEKGNIKGIAGQLGSVLKSQGANVEDVGAQKRLIGEVTAAVQATGKGASEILGAMDDIFSKMPEELRKKVGPEFMSQMAVVATTAGPGATAALQQYMGAGSIGRKPFEAQGFGNVIGKDGMLNLKELFKFIKAMKGRIGFDTRASLKTAGFSEEAADGLLRIANSSKELERNLDALSSASRDNEEVYRNTRGLVDSFKGSINTVKGSLETLFHAGGVSQKITDFLSSQVGSKGGSAAVVAGGATIAAMLAGGGLRGITGLVGGEMKKKAFEEVTGEKVQDVFVVNFDQMGKGGGPGGSMESLKKFGAVGGAVGGGLAAGAAIGEGINYIDQQMGGGMSDAIVSGFDKLDKWMGGKMSGTNRNDQPIKVHVETKTPNLRATDKPQRGSAN